MEYTELEVHRSDISATLLPLLKGRVFHATSGTHWAGIRDTGVIDPNTDQEKGTTFGSLECGFFRRRGCVSVFDWRDPWYPEKEEHALSCWPLEAAARDCHAVFLLLGENSCERLIPWTAWEKEGSAEEAIVKHVEAGHPGPIPLAAIDRIIEAKILDGVLSPKADP